MTEAAKPGSSSTVPSGRARRMWPARIIALILRVGLGLLYWACVLTEPPPSAAASDSPVTLSPQIDPDLSFHGSFFFPSGAGLRTRAS